MEAMVYKYSSPGAPHILVATVKQSVEKVSLNDQIMP